MDGPRCRAIEPLPRGRIMSSCKTRGVLSNHVCRLLPPRSTLVRALDWDHFAPQTRNVLNLSLFDSV
ncbi:hypothetical protein CY34DRAFT_194363 [Suillus luteus UH-Slu-Lm8-n1]|uniref:Uncharacterized protein n=1 Tax=Suillus luteus UH-Slu-Lm8-n1 TaxID=930992 RepID=A0A0D0BED3_9AGAM|nr:hypothetical protein CY34DRAFT_194363 [Suillus luteus UH-Slu-Lm8-n1]